MSGYIIKGTIITPLKKLKDKVIFVKDGKIEKVIHREEYKNYSEEYLKCYEVIEAGNNLIGPGFIDIHTHGANDADAVKVPE